MTVPTSHRSYERCDMQLYSTVRLKVDLLDEGLRRGAMGVIVGIFEERERAYDVEFSDDQGRTIAEIALREDQIEPIRST